MNVVFFGTPEWAAVALRALASSRHRVRGVVTSPDAPVRRSRTPVPPPVKATAQALALAPVLQPATLRDPAARAAILDLAPDALVVVAYGRILPGRLLDAPRFGAINLHFSLLPRHRGASPVQHTILAGDARAGVTTLRMDRGLDTGPVLEQWSTDIAPGETAATLGARLAAEGARLLALTLDRVEAGDLAPRPQDDAAATVAPLIAVADGFVNWSEPAHSLERRVRAFDPWPPVVCRGARGPLRLVAVEALRTDASASASAGAPPGLVLARQRDAVDVAAGAGTTLRLHRVQPAGGKEMTAAAALAGRYFSIGGALLDGSGA